MYEVILFKEGSGSVTLGSYELREAAADLFCILDDSLQAAGAKKEEKHLGRVNEAQTYFKQYYSRPLYAVSLGTSYAYGTERLELWISDNGQKTRRDGIPVKPYNPDEWEWSYIGD